MIISNESRINRSGVVSNFKKPRQFVASISIRHRDMLLVEPITVSMKTWLDNSKDIDHSLPFFVGLSSLDNHSCNLGILVSLSAMICRCSCTRVSRKFVLRRVASEVTFHYVIADKAELKQSE